MREWVNSLPGLVANSNPVLQLLLLCYLLSGPPYSLWSHYRSTFSASLLFILYLLKLIPRSSIYPPLRSDHFSFPSSHLSPAVDSSGLLSLRSDCGYLLQSKSYLPIDIPRSRSQPWKPLPNYRILLRGAAITMERNNNSSNVPYLPP